MSACSRIRLNQCKACPWKVSTVPDRDIPGGYSEEKHRNLRRTIADPSNPFGSSGSAMACHESPVGAEQMCAGWVANQLGPGNNIALRLQSLDGRFKGLKLDGPQREHFEDTLPKRKRRRATP